MKKEPYAILKYEEGIMETPVSVPGKVLKDILIPAYGFLRAQYVNKGQFFRIIDVEGQQVPDVMLYDASDLKHRSSCTSTTLILGKWKIGKGDTVYSNHVEAMAKIIEDTVGHHHSRGGMCTSYVNRARYGVDGTHTCL